MIIAVDFDGTIVSDAHSYADLESPLVLLPWALEGLTALKKAGHVLILYSARANLALRYDATLDPLVRAGLKNVDTGRWSKAQPLNEARYQQMVVFVSTVLHGIFDAIDDGLQGKPVVDAFIDDRAIRKGHGPLGYSWREIALIYGEPVYSNEAPPIEQQGDNT
jgi:hypothetical protein